MDFPKSIPGIGLVDGQFADENATTGQIGSLIPASWGNAVTKEILAVVKAAGLTPSESDVTQLLKAIQTLSATDAKRSVVCATTGPIALSGLQTIDGVPLVGGERVLVKNQANAAQNWIYVADGGAWQRAQDANESIECVPGHLVPVQNGTVNYGTVWQFQNTGWPTLGTSQLTFVQVQGRTGVSAGTYKSVTVDQFGHVTGGSNPTSLAGYGISDAYNKTDTASLITQATKDLAPKATTLAGYGITDGLRVGDAYNKTDTAYLITQATKDLAPKAATLAGYGITDGLRVGDAYNKTDTAYLITQATKDLAPKATTLAGYGISDAYNKSETYNRGDIKSLIGQAVDALLPKRSFAFNDFIRIPDVPGGLVFQMGSAVVGPESSLNVSLPIAFNTILGVIAGVGGAGWNGTGNYSAYAVPVSNGVVKLTQDVSTSSGAGNQTIYYLAWGN